jgi:hypothetical protein
MNEERNKFGGWEQNPGKPGEFRAKIVTGPVTPDFADFAEESRARWDLVEWLKVKLGHLLNKGTSIK